MNFENLIVDIKNQTATIQINRPKSLNALNPNVLRDLKNAFTHLKSSEAQIKGVILTGSGEKAFVAGADIAAMQEMTALEADEFCKLGHQTMSLIEKFEHPVIAAVNGFALGGGLELALSCDFIYASSNAVFGLPETKLGLFPGFGGTQRLSRLVGKSLAKEMIYTAKTIDAETGKTMGFVNQVFSAENLMAETQKTLAQIYKNGSIAISLAKRVINAGTDLPLENGLALEQSQFPLVFATKDCKEGVTAFLQKRKAEFQGQ